MDAPAEIGSSRMLARRLCRFSVLGEAVGQPRATQTRRGGKRWGYVDKDHPVHAFRDAVRLAARQAWRGKPVGGPIELVILILMPRPKSMIWKTKPMVRVPHVTKPDRNNVVKAIEDAMKGIVWVDDNQIYKSAEEKWIAAGDEKPRVIVEVLMQRNRLD